MAGSAALTDRPPSATEFWRLQTRASSDGSNAAVRLAAYLVGMVPMLTRIISVVGSRRLGRCPIDAS